MFDLSGKTILVTGASKGIGAATVERLGRAGASVVAHYGSDRAGAEAATRNIDPGRKRLIAADFSDLDSVEVLWEEAEHWHGRIDVFVNNATDERAQISVYEPSYPTLIDSRTVTNRPRTIGIRFGQKFN